MGPLAEELHTIRTEPRSTARADWGSFVIVLVWIGLLGLGGRKLFIDANAPGEPARAPRSWPMQSAIPRELGFATLLLFVHSYCSCSEASVEELARLVPSIKDKVKSRVIIYRPQAPSEKWVKNRLWGRAAEIPFVETVPDPEGEEYRRFGAYTSGQAMLYDPNGALIFSGGITSSRGHLGDSAGRAAILNYVTSGNRRPASSAVYGCALNGPEKAKEGRLE